jgi:hypothetical protein
MPAAGVPGRCAIVPLGIFSASVLFNVTAPPTVSVSVIVTSSPSAKSPST